MNRSKLIVAPKPRTEFRIFNGRLALFHESSNHLDYWRGYWSDEARASLTAKGLSGDLGEFERLLTTYLPRNLQALEAGCGPAHIVAALRSRGFNVVGIDYEPEVVRFVNEALPDLDVRHGNILSLEFPNESLGGYISVGVVEHFPGGPAPALVEARRVMHPDGVALISVPYLNPLRKVLFDHLDEGACNSPHANFHQYDFSQDEFSGFLRQAGFRVVEILPYGVMAVLVREHPFFRRFWHSPFCRERLKRPLRYLMNHASAGFRKRYAHMAMYICRPQR